MSIDKYLLSPEEQMACSLVSRYPFVQVQDVIREACLHQIEHLIAQGWKSPDDCTDCIEKCLATGEEAHGIKEGRKQVIKKLRDEWNTEGLQCMKILLADMQHELEEV